MSFHPAMEWVAPTTEKAAPASPADVFIAGNERAIMATYFDKLKDPRWQKKRLMALEKSFFACELCGDESQTLHVHHKQYFKGREPWDYEVSQLSVLCESCHKCAHDEEDPLLLACSHVELDGPFSRQTIAALVAGFCNQGMTAEHAKADPDTYITGELANAMFEWSNDGLRVVEKIRLTELAKSDFAGMMECLRAYIRSKGGV